MISTLKRKHQAGIEPTGLQYIPTKRFQLSISTTAFHLVYKSPQHKTHDAISTPMASEALGRGQNNFTHCTIQLIKVSLK